MSTLPQASLARATAASPTHLQDGRRDRAQRRSGRRPVLRVDILDECPLITLGAQAMLKPFASTIEVRSAAAGIGALERVDITLYDPAGRCSTTSITLDALLADPARGRIVIYSFDPLPALVAGWLTRGCAAVVDKGASTAVLVDVITSLAPGQPAWGRAPHPVPGHPGPVDSWPGHENGLSRRESEVLALVVEGVTNKDISERTYLSISTVKTHIRHAYRKLDIDRRTQAVRWGMQHGMLDAPALSAVAQTTG